MKFPLELLLIWAASSMAEEVTQTISKHRVLLLSFDGFRWDYVGRFPTPNLDALADQGVHAPLGVRTAFVTKTFPDHYTLATGLYEESHGIISNRMYDPLFNATFRPGNNETRWWDGGQPIWITATLQGLKTGVYFWPGSEVELNGVRPYRWEPYKKSVPFEDRVNTVVDWFMDDHMDLVAVYFHEPDQSGHVSGVMSSAVGEAVQRVDNLLGYFFKKLKQEGIFESTDILIVSDHGMTNVTADDTHVIVLSDFLNFEENIQIMPDEGALANILPRTLREEFVFQKLSGAHPNMTVFMKENIPESLHYKHHRRIQPILALADDGFYITQTRPYNTKHHEIGPGEHGYDNGLSSMRPIFFARGPHFKQGFNLTDSYETVNVYPLICHLLGIQPAPNNGTLEASLDMLQEMDNGCDSLQFNYVILVLVVMLINLLKFE